MVFDSGGSTGRLHACPFLGTWRAPLYGEVIVRGLHEAATFFGGRIARKSLTCRSGTSESFTLCVSQSIAAFSAAKLV